MAARNTTLNLVPGTWTQLTDNDVTSITFQNKGSYTVFVAGTAGATPPTTTLGAIEYGPGRGERKALMGDLFPGISATRVYALCRDPVEVYVSHA